MVEWKSIGSSCKTVSPPKKLEREMYSDDGQYPIIDQGQKDIVGFTDDVSALVADGEYVLFGDHTRYVKYHKGRFAQGADGLKILNPIDSIIPRYFFYIFEKTDVPSRGYSRHWSIAKEILIPIPSLSEQKRIVGILDTFTASIENLKEQITQRRKQFEHYRDQLLDLEGKKGVEVKSLKEIVKSYCTGATPKKGTLEYYEGGTVPWLRTQDVKFNEIYTIDSYVTNEAVEKTGIKWIPANCVIIAISGATAGRCAINKIPTTTNQHCLNLEINPEDALYKYVFYCVYNAYDKMISKKQGVRGDLNSSIILRIRIPVPSLDEQSRIVSILDTFEASIENLEAQLSQREKQYEYYRNKLMTFE